MFKDIENFVKFSKENQIRILPEEELINICDLVMKMMAFDPNERINCEDIINHIFFKNI